jgi:predicted GNAT family N-acyltransferase
VRRAGVHGPPARVRRLAGPAELEAALTLREQVFCAEQGVSVEAERDALDAAAVQFGAFAGAELVGTCRLLPGDPGGVVAVVGRVAVRADRRRSGVGRLLIAAARDEARRLGARELSLHAQIESDGFYLSLGFTRRGRPFVEEGIDHIAMYCQLEPLS